MSDPTRAAAFAMPVYLAPPQGAASKNITTAATTIVDAVGPGFVAGISVNTGVAGKTLKLYDGDPGAAGVLLGTWSAAAAASWSLAIPYATSLYAVTDGVADITISYA